MLDRERLTKTLTSIKEFKAKDEFDNFTSNQTIVGFLLYLCRVDPSEKITHQCSLLDDDRIPLYQADALCEFLTKFGYFCTRYKADKPEGYIVSFHVTFR